MSEANDTVFITLTEPCFIGSTWHPRGAQVEMDKRRAKRYTNPGGGRKSVALPGKHDVKATGKKVPASKQDSPTLPGAGQGDQNQNEPNADVEGTPLPAEFPGDDVLKPAGLTTLEAVRGYITEHGDGWFNRDEMKGIGKGTARKITELLTAGS